MKKVTLSCDQCGKAAPGDAGVLPADWHELSAHGFLLGEFCAECSPKVNVTKLIEVKRTQRASAQAQ